MDIENADGTVLQKIDPAARRHLHINPLYLRRRSAQGLREAASQPGGTSDDVMGNFPEQVYGKTGTAQYITERPAEDDYAWYACFVPATATSKPIVVVGHGSRRAASATSPRRRSRGRSCRSGSSASPGRTRAGARPTL